MDNLMEFNKIRTKFKYFKNQSKCTHRCKTVSVWIQIYAQLYGQSSPPALTFYNVKLWMVHYQKGEN